MGHTLTLLTAVLLVGQTPEVDSNGKNCPCKNGQKQGRVLAQPEFAAEVRTVGWMNWRNTSATTENWRSSSQEASWVDNRPILSRIRGWFKKNDDGGDTTIRNESVQPAKSPPVTVQPRTTAPEYFRRLPTTNEPPLGASPAQPIIQPKPAAPVIRTPAKVAPVEEKPLTIEIEPIQFRPAGSAKGVAPAVPLESSTPPTSVAVPSNRPNLIDERFVNKVGQPGDYSWITGQLEIRGKTFVVHYATPETVDRFEGSLALSADSKLLANVRNGDLVSVRGIVVQQSGRNVYRVQSIDLIER